MKKHLKRHFDQELSLWAKSPGRKPSKKNIISIKRLAILALIGITVNACSSDDSDPTGPICISPRQDCMQPQFLKQGDTIAIISPSYITSDENIEKGMEVIRSWGFVPVKAPNLNQAYLERYAGTIAQRASDIEWAYNNPQVKAIMCTRGGYGTIQLLDVLPSDVFTKHPKWLIGYSDVTIPIAHGFHAGHAGVNHPLIEGAQVTLQVSNHQASLDFKL